MRAPHILRRAVAVVALLLVSGMQVATWACPMSHDGRTLSVSSAPAGHPHAAAAPAPSHAHHELRAPAPSLEGAATLDATPAGECSMMLVCTTPAAATAALALESASAGSQGAVAPLDDRYVGPLLTRRTPPPKAA
jgi:hypothetical protein